MRISVLILSLVIAVSALAQRSEDLIVPITAARDILIPAAGDVPGANGTHFRSDISIVNLREATQRVYLYWYPQGSSGSSVQPRALDIAPTSGVQSDNFVTTIMGQSGLGSIEVLGVTTDGLPDAGAQLHVAARIWTPRPDGAAGTMSQTFPAIVLGSEAVASKAVFGLRRTGQFRLNVGISNPGTETRRYRVTTFVAPLGQTPVQTQFDVEVAPKSMEQRAIDSTAEGVAQVLITDITGTPVPGPWHAWASSVDNESGDAWSQMAVPGS
jgi:hypothetical protein